MNQFVVGANTIAIPNDVTKKFEEKTLVSFSLNEAIVYYDVAQKKLGRPFMDDAEASDCIVEEIKKVINMYD